MTQDRDDAPAGGKRQTRQRAGEPVASIGTKLKAVYDEVLAEPVPDRLLSLIAQIEATGGGILCEPNDPESLATAVEELLRNPDAARAMGGRGMEVVRERFSVRRMAEGMVRVFGQAVKPRDVAHV